jgi:hypothetical protein
MDDELVEQLIDGFRKGGTRGPFKPSFGLRGNSGWWVPIFWALSMKSHPQVYNPSQIPLLDS